MTLSARLSVLVTAALLVPTAALATGTGMPWETPIQNALDSITGPVLKAAAIVAIVLCGVGFAMGETGGMMRRIFGILFGIAIAFAATQWGVTFFGFAGGAGF
jgi:type IV secretion system protein TrbC